MQTVNPEGWKRPKGYSNGTTARGRMVFTGGLVGWDETESFPSSDFIDQVRQVLKNTVAVLGAADAGPEHVVRMTWYITDKHEYLARLKEMGEAYREVMGRTFPAMAMVQVAALIEDDAKVEVETTAVVPD
ncbi:putative reactive intermediate deaminase TdcF [wastewater metagenome]|uniref:Putative reactive intermediate deaminase TdcF n=3 Tax=root TaxID=1 RepID=A0A5B8R9D6_9ZZZZ|nr:RidA family protein [Arhodomonas aquaeolei]MCS4503993.1 RidA family protein [Arhodomonas aquaeolei]QEA05779.1 putative reactive intermediate deaminase TdcF [uncultured organism]